jgi:hypothetical protein
MSCWCHPETCPNEPYSLQWPEDIVEEQTGITIDDGITIRNVDPSKVF